MAKKRRKKTSESARKVPSAPVPPSTDDIPPLQSMEKLLSVFGGGWGKKLTGVDAAQEIMYDAWEARSEKQAVALAKKALSVSADCADAYNLLAEYAGSLEERTELYRQGVAAGERALGKRTFREDVGYFWGLLETRPYMRARAGLARCLWTMGQHAEAVAHYQDMLRLNPNDNQGMRDVLMPCLLEMGDLEEAERLYERYKEDAMAVWAYSRALLDFRAGGDCAKARKALKKAIEHNGHVPAYLAGKKKLPRVLPDLIGFGDDNEAVAYVADNATCWEATPGALEWLAANAP